MIKSKKTLQSLSLLSIGSLFSSGSTFVIYTVLARKIGAESFGIFSSAMATAKIFLLMAGFGIPQVWLKLFGKEGWRGIRWVKPSLKFVFLSLILVSVSIFALTLLTPEDTRTNTLLLLLILFICGNIFIELISSKFQLEERYDNLAFWQLSPNLLRLIIILMAFFLFGLPLTEIDIGIIYAGVGGLFTILGVSHLIKMARGKFELKGHEKTQYGDTLDKLRIKDVIEEAWPFGMASMFAFVYMQSDIIMVKYISGNVAAGQYNISFVILTALLLIPTILFSKFLMPKYHRWANHEMDKFYRVYKKGNIAMILSGSFFMLVLLLLSSYLIPFVFGEEYVPSIVLINILALTLPMSFLAYSLGATLVTKEHMKLKVKLMGLVAIVNVVLNFWLIPKHGAKGAAIATVISNLVLLGLYYLAVKKRVFLNKTGNYE